MRIHTRSALALVLLVGAACASAPPASTKPVHRIVRNDCESLAAQVVPLAANTALDSILETVACAGQIAPAPAPDRWYVQRHLAQDEAMGDVVEVGAMIATCLLDTGCDPAVDPETFAYVHPYAAVFSMDALEDALDLRPSDRVGRQFVERVREAVSVIRIRALGLDSRLHEILVNIPARIRDERKVHRAALAGFEKEAADHLTAIDAALGSTPIAGVYREHLKNARALRERVLLACAAKRPLRDCMDGPIIRPLTERMVQLSLGLGDAPQAAAENEQLQLGRDRSTYPVQMAAELGDAFAAHQDAAARFKEARRKGMTPLMLEVAFGRPFPEPVPNLAWPDPRRATDYESRLAALTSVKKIEGIVSSSRGRGGALEIAFGTERCTRPSPVCSGKAEAPVLLAIDEARLLRVGERLEAIVESDSRRGVVLHAYRAGSRERIVQVRGTRLGK